MLNIYALHDIEGKVFQRPVALSDDVVAKRMFRTICKNELGEFKNEFEYSKIGVLDEKTGKILPCEEPEVIITGSIVQFNQEGGK